MGHKEHQDAAGRSAVKVSVIVVSSSRRSGEDRSGPWMVGALTDAGHEVGGVEFVSDDFEKIRLLLTRLRDAKSAQAVLLTGGTGISGKDSTFEAVRAVLDRELPGFGELFRMLSFQQIGASAMLSRAIGGVAGGLIVFAMPGSPKACELAMERLILPELRHLVYELAKEGPPPPKPAPERVEQPKAELASTDPKAEGAPEGEEILGGVRLILSEEGSDGEEQEEIHGWQRFLQDRGGELDFSGVPPIPQALQAMPAVMDVLDSSGERATTQFGGQTYAAFGFPDLRRLSSNVILVGQGTPYGEILALHRWPTQTGVCRKGGGVLPSRGRMSRTSMDVTGREYPEDGRLFAVGAKEVRVENEGRVWCWNGRNLKAEGQTASVLATLLLAWSQR